MSADYDGFRILNMFNLESRPTITESVVQSADSVVDWTILLDSNYNLASIGVWIWALSPIPTRTILFDESAIGMDDLNTLV